MKRLVITLAVLALTVCAQGQTSKKPAKSKPDPVSQAATIPKEAVQKPDGTYNYTDAQGKKWIYTKSPFGVIKTAAPDAVTQSNKNDAAALTKAIDKGDTVRFERPSPFGTVSWEKKKTELTDDERQLFESQNPSQNTQSDAK